MNLIELEEEYKRFAVKIDSDGSQGSGCLVTNSELTHSYIFTAKHCLTDTENCKIESIKIKRFHGNDDEQPLQIEKILLHKTLDLAIIVLKDIFSENSIAYKHPKKEDQVEIYGYPYQLIGQSEPRENLSCKITFVHDSHFELSSNLIQFNYDQGIPENLIGFSGSGVFSEYGGNLILKGIFVKLKGPKGVYNKLCSINVGEYTKLLEANGYGTYNAKDDVSNINREEAITKKVFYLPYTIESEPYYLKRNIDETFDGLLKSSKDIWISGNSGVGKTNLIFRNLAVINKSYIFIDLSANENRTIEQYFEYINDEIKEQFNIKGSIVKTSVFDSIVHNLLKVELDNNETVLFIDEIPIANNERFQEFLNGFILISEKYNALVKGAKIIKWIISTRIDPMKHLKERENLINNSVKAKKNFNFKNLEEWDKKDLNDLINILKSALSFELSDISQNSMIIISKGFPGPIKDCIERIIIENCTTEKAIQYLSSENLQI